MSEEVASHSDESQETGKETAVKEAFTAFGIEIEEETGDSEEEHEEEAEEETPATESTPEPKMIKVKHNKEEIEVDVSDDKLPEYVQKSLALDKERERKTELERNLDRAAKLAGYENHAAYVADLDRLEREAEQRQKDQFAEMRQQLREEAEEAGIDPAKLDAWLDNHPLLKEAQKAIQERDKAEEERTVQTAKQQAQSKWDELYAAYPDLIESSRAFNEGGTPDWFTPDMQARISRGYDPKDAYELAHKSTIMQQTAKKAEQKSIKDQMLGKRSQVLAETTPNDEPEVSPALATAFSMFGLNPSAAKKYAKK